VAGALAPGRGADHLHLLSRVGMIGAVPPLLRTSSWRGASLSTGCLHGVVLS